MSLTRIEHDTLGPIEVPSNKLYGAQTARSLIHFKVGHELMPYELIMQYLHLKKGCALSNYTLGKLPEVKKNLIVAACDELLKGNHQDSFPLYVYQTGSGTQTNMNVNEVIANLANLQAGSPLGSKKPIHPNDDVNMSQSSNDTFPTVMHMSAVWLIEERLIPHLKTLHKELKKKEQQFHEVIKIGRTHLMDAVPLSLGQEFSGYTTQLADNLNRLSLATTELYELPIGGSAVGTGLNTPQGFAQTTCKILSELTGKPYKEAKNKFSQMAAHDSLINLSSALKTLSCSLMKISHDIAWMGSGPRCGLGELILPENEPGSSIMPGKVNPTQCESLCMVAAQVHGYDTAVAMAGSLGNFELNVYKPLIINNIISSITLLCDAMSNFTQYFVIPLSINQTRITSLVENSLMLVTALTPRLGYDTASKLAHYAYKNNLSLKEAAVLLKLLSAEEFDKLIDIKKMTNQ